MTDKQQQWLNIAELGYNIIRKGDFDAKVAE
jgi:hypothetical protein